MLNIKFINNNGGGFARTIPVEDGTTLGDFLKDEMDGESLSNYKIRHNETRVCDWDSTLQDGDRILVTPIKMGGAAKKAKKAKKQAIKPKSK